MTQRMRFKSRDGRNPNEWEVIGGTERSLILKSTASGRVLYSINRDRLEPVTETEEEA